jgi:hypothetical protein
MGRELGWTPKNDCDHAAWAFVQILAIGQENKASVVEQWPSWTRGWRQAHASLPMLRQQLVSNKQDSSHRSLEGLKPTADRHRADSRRIRARRKCWR